MNGTQFKISWQNWKISSVIIHDKQERKKVEKNYILRYLRFLSCQIFGGSNINFSVNLSHAILVIRLFLGVGVGVACAPLIWQEFSLPKQPISCEEDFRQFLSKFKRFYLPELKILEEVIIYDIEIYSRQTRKK